MRVLFLSDLHDPRIGSSVRQIHQLAAHLRAHGHATELATAVTERELVGLLDVDGLRVHRLFDDSSPRWRGWTSVAARAIHDDLERVLAGFRPDVVHAHLLHAHLGYESLTRARRAGAGVVFTAHDVMTFCYQKLTCFHGGPERGGTERDYPAYWQKCIPCQRLRWNPWRNAAIRRVLARDVQRFTVVSDELGAAIRANGIRVDRTLHNAVRLQARLPSADDVAAFRARFGLSGARVLTIGGRLHEQKGVGQLLAMLARLAPRYPDLRLLVLGRREVYEREFEPRARSLAVAERVVATGWLDGDELQAAYAATDVFVTPSICFDTFGLVNLEAMEHAKPVVATCFGGSPEVVRDGETGFVANPFDLEGFAGAIARLLDDPQARRRMGAAGRERLVAHFTIPRLAAECLEEYELALRLARG
ncbi:MAG: glycosyltransferase family 4 protein [Planctomycetes bacterium]|nr:glycosyltransferase family 4 protein [Planctomycetota bacterium]